MNQSDQFWWSWWVSFSVAIATFAAVIVALFGEWIRSVFFKPKLNLRLRNDVGERTTVTFQWQTPNGLQQESHPARYYHARVSNNTRWPKATQLQVHLVRVEEPGPDGELQITWSGDVPIRWMHQEIYPLARTIGPAADCDLCSVVKDKWIQLHPLLEPNNLDVKRQGPVTLVVSILAKANEGESSVHRFEIAWDGKWEDGDVEMKRHLIVKEI